MSSNMSSLEVDHKKLIQVTLNGYASFVSLFSTTWEPSPCGRMQSLDRSLLVRRESTALGVLVISRGVVFSRIQ